MLVSSKRAATGPTTRNLCWLRSSCSCEFSPYWVSQLLQRQDQDYSAVYFGDEVCQKLFVNASFTLRTCSILKLWIDSFPASNMKSSTKLSRMTLKLCTKHALLLFVMVCFWFEPVELDLIDLSTIELKILSVPCDLLSSLTPCI